MLVASLVLLCSAHATGAGWTVQTDQGAVRGVVRNGALEFRGIPYAAAPVGELRWALPQPAAAWEGVRDASEFGSACPQQARFNLTEASADEDCLTLNVSVPVDRAPGERLPVFVWIHGGAFVGGASSLYRLDQLARAGRMVVVSMNYRLGVFGYMPHPVFAHDGYNGNYALEDQRAALRWVQRNIEAFGGDRDNVTLAGESAGAAAVCMHLASPERVQGLFHKAVVQSAGCLHPMKTVAEAQQAGVALGERVVGAAVAAGRCKAGNPHVLECMRSIPVEDLLEAQGRYAEENADDLALFGPVTGTVTVPRTFREAVEYGRIARVPVLIGGTRDELRLYVGYWVQEGRGITAENFRQWIERFYPGHGDAVAAQYAPGDSPPATFGSMLSDYNPAAGINNCLYLRTAQAVSAYNPVYAFEFADRDAPVMGVGIVPPDPGFPLGAAHSSELNYLFPNLSNTTKIDAPDLSPAGQALAAKMVRYWAQFARTGDTAVSGLPEWPRYRGGATVMRLEPGKVAAYDAGAEHRCGFWKTLYPETL